MPHASQWNHRVVELLAPARNLECGRTAIDCGADAVYIGAPRFGAREAAGNALEDIEALARHAHRFWARVYVTLNTLLRDEELQPAVELAWRVYEIGADGLIIQDPGLLECDLPPLPLIASTQMHNHSPARVAFLEKIGFRRAILARELEIGEIRAIRRAAPEIELEFFVHGALCVCYSGQCYLSYALGGRSGNRGQCAQPCRKPYSLVDSRGQVLDPGRHLLSLRDLNLSEHLPELLDAGIRCFKIEGRLKDRAYVANVVAHYRRLLDLALPPAGLKRSSSGASDPGFTPDPAKTFNRGFTTYFLHGRSGRIGSPETPKMMGEPVGRVTAVEGGGFTVETRLALHPGDGVCFLDRRGTLCGTSINQVSGKAVTPDRMEGIEPGILLHRNRDHRFLGAVEQARPVRRLRVTFALRSLAGGMVLEAVDEDRNSASAPLPPRFEQAAQPERAADVIRRQLSKTGDTEFAAAGVSIELESTPFLPVSAWNALRRGVLDQLRAVREAARPRLEGGIVPCDAPFPEKELSYLGNVLNAKAEAFYRRHGVERIEPAAESGLDLRGRKVMTTRYCLKHQLDLCPLEGGGPGGEEPLFLVDEEGHRLELRFDCSACRMEVYLAGA